MPGASRPRFRNDAANHSEMISSEAWKASFPSRCARPTWWRQAVRDYAGDTVAVIVDQLTGKTRQAQNFAAVMAAANFTYVEATRRKRRAHARLWCHSVAMPRLFVPDNANVSVVKASLYEPQVNAPSPLWHFHPAGYTGRATKPMVRPRFS